MKNIVVLTGAGISAESGFSTFRDANGLWENYPVEKVATPEGWNADHRLVTDFYNQLRTQLVEARPNAAHFALAELEQNFRVSIITQNVDDLHERAGSTQVVHLHGELMKVSSSHDPNNPKFIQTLDKDHLTVAHDTLASDGSLLRPWIVWFGEAVPEFERAIQLAEQADIFVVVGTSLQVYPAAGLLNYVPQHAQVYLIDPKEVKTSIGRDICFIQEVATKGMQILMETLKQEI